MAPGRTPLGEDLHSFLSALGSLGWEAVDGDRWSPEGCPERATDFQVHDTVLPLAHCILLGPASCGGLGEAKQLRTSEKWHDWVGGAGFQLPLAPSLHRRDQLDLEGTGRRANPTRAPGGLRARGQRSILCWDSPRNVPTDWSLGSRGGVRDARSWSPLPVLPLSLTHTHRSVLFVPRGRRPP